MEFEDLLDYKKLNKYIKEKIQDNKIYYLLLSKMRSKNATKNQRNSS